MQFLGIVLEKDTFLKKVEVVLAYKSPLPSQDLMVGFRSVVDARGTAVWLLE